MKLPLAMSESQAIRKSCGECTACCTVIGVEELKKDPYTKCEHLKENCSIYEERPNSCKIFECLYLSGNLLSLDERNRPDKLGVIFTHPAQMDETLPILVVWECYEGAFYNQKVQYLIERLSHVAVLFLNYYQFKITRKIIGPAKFISRIEDIARIQTIKEINDNLQGQPAPGI